MNDRVLSDMPELIGNISETNLQKKRTSKNKIKIGFRTLSRLMAVQGLYMMDLTQKKPSDVINDLQIVQNTKQFSKNQNDLFEQISIPDDFDYDFSLSILRGIIREQRVIDPLISEMLSDKWRFDRLDRVTSSILRAAVYELLFSGDVPPKVIINEYTNIASGFNLNTDNALINGILNAIYMENNLDQSE